MTDRRDPAEGNEPEPEPMMEAREVVERLGLHAEHIDAQEAAEALARGLAVALMDDDREAVGLLIDGFCEEHPGDIVRALIAAAGLVGELVGVIAHRLGVRETAFLEFDAERSRTQHETARTAVAAIVDGVPAEGLDPEVDALRAAMVRDAYLLDAVDGAEVEADERIDIELRALLEADGTDLDGIVGDVTRGGEGSH